MHRLNGRDSRLRLPLSLASVLALAAAATLAAGSGCGGKKPANDVTTDQEGGTDDSEGGAASAEQGDGGPVEKKDDCVGFDVANIEDVLVKSTCEESNVKPDSLQAVDLKGKLEVTVTASPMKPPPGGKVDLLVTFANKSKEPLVLHFRIDPVPRFEIEVYETTKKGTKRVDMPTTPTPPPPKGATQPPSSEAKSARVTIAPNGTARARMPWDAVKMKWAPEKYRGTPPERGFPRGPAGPLPKGKYTVKVVTPLIGVSEGVDKEMSAPRVDIEVGG